MDYKEHLKEKMEDPGFKREYEALAHEFDAFDVNEKVKQGLNDVRLMKERKIKPKTLKGFLCEL